MYNLSFGVQSLGQRLHLLDAGASLSDGHRAALLRKAASEGGH